MPTVDPKFLSQIRYRCIGPTRGGRVVAVAADPKRQSVFYFGAVAGGVWKSDDAGQYWENVTDGFLTSGVDRRVGSGALRRERDLRRHGRIDDPHRRHPRRRRLQVDRCRRDVAAHGPHRVAAHRRDPRPSRRSGPRVRRRARPRIEGQPGAWAVPLEGRRRELGARAARQRTRRRGRRVARPQQPADHLRHHLADPPHVLVDRQRWT